MGNDKDEKEFKILLFSIILVVACGFLIEEVTGSTFVAGTVTLAGLYIFYKIFG